MKLIFLLLFAFVPLHLCSTNYIVSGELLKYNSVSFNPSSSGLCTFYIRIDDIPIGYDLYFKISISSGSFEDGNLHYAPYYTPLNVGDEIGLPNQIPFDYYSSTTKSYYYILKKNDNYPYLFISSPIPKQYDAKSSVTITNTVGPTYFFLGDLSKFSYKSFNPNQKGKYGVYCIKTSDFPKESVINFKTTLTSGSFAYGYMYYGGYNTQLKDGQEVILSNYAYCETSSIDNEYFFSIQKINEKFLCVAPPPPHNFGSTATVTVYNSYKPYNVQYKVLGKLSMSGMQTFIPNDVGTDCVYYIKLNDFPNDIKNLQFKVELSSGSFENEYMFYGYLNTELNYGNTIYLPSNVKKDSTSIFTVSKESSYTYLYIAPPPPYDYTTQSQITVSNIFKISVKVIGELSKFSSQTFSPTQKGEYCAYYINTKDFQYENELYFKVTLTSGNFMDNYMYYGGNKDKYTDGTQISLPSYVSYSNKIGNTYIFTIPKFSYNYIYIASSKPYNYNSQSRITVSNLYSISEIKYDILGELPKSGKQTFTPSDVGKYCAYYISLDDFTKDVKSLQFKVELSSGSFEHKYMFYEYSNTELGNNSTITLSYNVKSDSSGNFNVPTASYKFLYIAPPPPYEYTAQSRITVSNIYTQHYLLLGELSKFSEKTYSPSQKGEYCAYCINTEDFPNDNELYFNVTLTSGSLKGESMFYGGSNDRITDGKSINLPVNVTYSSKYENTYSFTIPKITYKFLYFGPSRPYNYNSQSKITVANLYRISKINYKILGELPQFGEKEFNPNFEEKYCAYYIRLDDFSKNYKLKFKVELNSGSFEHKHMFYGYLNKELDSETTIILPSNVKSDSFGNFNILTSASYKFLYFAPPPIYDYTAQSRITVYNILYYVLLGELSKYSEKTFSPTEKGEFCSYRINIDNFPNDSQLYFKVTLTSGSFKDDYIYYLETDDLFNEGDEIVLINNISYSNISDGSYIFTIPKTKSKYLYISPSRPYNYDSQSKIKISNLYRPYEIFYNILEELPKAGQKTFNPTELGKYCAYYIRLEDFPKNIKNFKFKVELTYGSFEHEYMFYGYLNEELDKDTTISLPNNVKIDSSGNFTIPTSASNKFLYIAPPPPLDYTDQSRIIVSNIYTQYYLLLGGISKYSENTFSPYQKGDYCAYCIDTYDFPKDSYLYFNVKLTSGNFKDLYMHYGGYSQKFYDGTEIALPFNVTYSNISDGSYTFIVPKTSEQYLYISPPRPINYDSTSIITVYSTFEPNSIAYTILGELKRYRWESFTPTEKGKYCSYYINTYDFPTDDELYFQVVLYHGNFENDKMYYEGFNTQFSIGKRIPLSDFNNSNSNSSTTNNSYSTTDDEYTYNFTIPKSSHKYLYIAPPPPSNYDPETSSIKIYSINNKTYTVLGELSKYKNETFDPNEKGKSWVLYIKTEDFSKDTHINFKVTLTNGNFKHGYMNYGSYNETFGNGKEITLSDFVFYSDSSPKYSSSFSSPIYKEITYYFKIPKPSNKYLYVAPPPPADYDSQSRITVNIDVPKDESSDSKDSGSNSSSNSKKVALGVGIGVPCFVILVVVIVILVCKNKRGKIKSSDVENSKLEPINLN